MSFWSRKILLLFVVAVLASLCGPAEGSIFDRLSRQPRDENKPQKTEMSLSCACDKSALACHCEVGIDANIMGNRIALQPKLNVEFIPKNVTLLMTVTDKDKTLYSRAIAGEDIIPPVCIPVPQFPVVGLCVSFNHLSFDLENKSASFCTVLDVNTMPVGLPVHPRMPVGCFAAGQKDGLKYTAPEIKIPGKEEFDKLTSNIQNIPSTLDNWSPFGGMKEALTSWGPLGRSADQADKPQADEDNPDASPMAAFYVA